MAMDSSVTNAKESLCSQGPGTAEPSVRRGEVAHTEMNWPLGTHQSTGFSSGSEGISRC